MTKEYIIYCDESIKTGKHFSDFYGGLLIKSNDISFLISKLQKKKSELKLEAELKWTKVTGQFLKYYFEVVDEFFKYVKNNKIKVRIMFRQSAYEPTKLSKEQIDQGYFLLYYQFIKHTFGLIYSNPGKEPVFLRLYFDSLPDNELNG